MPKLRAQFLPSFSALALYDELATISVTISVAVEQVVLLNPPRKSPWGDEGRGKVLMLIDERAAPSHVFLLMEASGNCRPLMSKDSLLEMVKIRLPSGLNFTPLRKGPR